MPLFDREAAGKAVDQATADYQKAKADLDFARENLYESIVAAHPEGWKDAWTIRELAHKTGLSFGRIGQIVRGE